MYESWEELSAKADHEGGILDLIFGYGLYEEDLPQGEDRLRELILKFMALKQDYYELCDLLPEPSWD